MSAGSGDDRYGMDVLSELCGEKAASYVGRSVNISSAVYLVTSFMPEHDPVRSELRTLAMELVSDTVSSVVSGSPSEARAIASSIVSLLEVCAKSGAVSRMNASLLEKTVVDFALVGRIPAGVSYSNVEAFLSDVSDMTRLKDIHHRPNISTRLPAPKTGERKGGITRSGFIASRGEKILALIKDKKRVGIRDVTRLFPGVSEKTVQRELTELVRLGLVRKEGERRWSSYVIA